MANKNSNIREIANASVIKSFQDAVLKYHPSNIQEASNWVLLDIVYGGADTIIQSGVLNLCVDFDTPDEDVRNNIRRILENFSAPVNMLRHTISIYLALLMYKPLSLGGTWQKGHEFINERFKYDVNGAGMYLDQFVKKISEQVLLKNRVGVLVNFPDVTRTDFALDKNKLRPYLEMFLCENIISWVSGYDLYGREVLRHVVLKRSRHVSNPDTLFELKLKTEYVIIRLENESTSLSSILDADKKVDSMKTMITPEMLDDEIDDTFVAYVYKFVTFEGRTDETFHTDMSRMYTKTMLSIDGKPMKRLPFFFIGGDNTHSIVRAPLLDLATLNMSYIQKAAKLGHNLYHVESPVPFITGVDPQELMVSADVGKTQCGKEPPVVGGLMDSYKMHMSQSEFTDIKWLSVLNKAAPDMGFMEGLILPPSYQTGSSVNPKRKRILMTPGNVFVTRSPDVKYGWMSYSGEGLAHAFQDLDRLERHMSVLGAKFMNDNNKSAIAAETAMIQRTGENATITTIADIVGSGMTNVLLMAMEYSGITGTEEEISSFKLQINVETLPQDVSPDILRALIDALPARVVTRKSIVEHLTRRGYYSEQTDPEAILQELIEEETDAEDLKILITPPTLRMDGENTGDNIDGGGAGGDVNGEQVDGGKGDGGNSEPTKNSDGDADGTSPKEKAAAKKSKPAKNSSSNKTRTASPTDGGSS